MKEYVGRAVDGIEEWNDLPARLNSIGIDSLGWAYYLTSKYNLKEEDIVELSHDLGILIQRAEDQI